MRQYDVYSNPAAALRAERPFVIVLQHDRLDWARSVIIAPLAWRSVERHPRLMPALTVAGRTFTLLTLDLAPINRHRLRGEPIDNLEGERFAIMRALNHIFSAAG